MTDEKNDAIEEMQVKFQLQDDGILYLEGVRVSYPHLWSIGSYKNPRSGKMEPHTSYSCQFLIPAAQIETVKKVVTAYIKAAREVNAKVSKLGHLLDPKIVKGTDKVAGFWILKTSNSFEYPAVYADHTGNPVDPNTANAEKELYAGRHVRIRVDTNAVETDDAEHPVKVWTNLLAIQALPVIDGDRFGKALSAKEAVSGFGEVEPSNSFAGSSDSDGFDDADDFDDDGLDDGLGKTDSDDFDDDDIEL